MKDPTRLLEISNAADDAPSALELELLRAGASEQPPAAAMQRLAETLGARAKAGSSTASVSRLPRVAAKKLSLVPFGVVAAGITLASVVWVTTHSPMRPATTLLTTTEPHARETPQTVAGPTASVPAQKAAERSTTHSLAQEVARIDAIRRLLANDRAKLAIAALQDYRRDFPSGLLQQEADVLSIEAERRAGDRRHARVLAARFLADHPDSPHSARVRELLGALGTDAH